MFKDYAARTPVGRVGRPEDVAQAIAFLIGNDFMTGHMLVCRWRVAFVGLKRPQARSATP